MTSEAPDTHTEMLQHLETVGVPEPFREEVARYPGAKLDENFGCLGMLFGLPLLVGAGIAAPAGAAYFWRKCDEANLAVLAGLHSDTKWLLLPVIFLVIIAICSLLTALSFREVSSKETEKPLKLAASNLRAKDIELVKNIRQLRPVVVALAKWVRRYAVRKATKTSNSTAAFLRQYYRYGVNIGARVTLWLVVAIAACLLPIKVWSIEGHDFLIRSLWFRMELQRLPLASVSRLVTACRTVERRRGGTDHIITFTVAWPTGEVQDLGSGLGRGMSEIKALEIVSKQISENAEHRLLEREGAKPVERDCFDHYARKLKPRGHARMERILRAWE